MSGPAGPLRISSRVACDPAHGADSVTCSWRRGSGTAERPPHRHLEDVAGDLVGGVPHGDVADAGAGGPVRRRAGGRPAGRRSASNGMIRSFSAHTTRTGQSGFSGRAANGLIGDVAQQGCHTTAASRLVRMACGQFLGGEHDRDAAPGWPAAATAASGAGRWRRPGGPASARGRRRPRESRRSTPASGRRDRQAPAGPNSTTDRARPRRASSSADPPAQGVARPSGPVDSEPGRARRPRRRPWRRPTV